MKAISCKIKQKLSKIRSANTEYVEEVLDVLYPHAIEYIEKWKRSVILQQALSEKDCPINNLLDELNRRLHEINNLPFTCWLKEQANFKEAKNRLIENKVIIQNRDSVSSENFEAQLNYYSLESMLANIVCYLQPTARDLKQTIFVPTEWKKLVKKNRPALILMSRNFELNAEGHLFLFLINKLENSSGNVFNSGKPHELQLRELMTKRILQGLYNNPQIKTQTTTFITDIALDLVGIFFESVNKRDEAQKMAERVAQNLSDEMSFVEKKVIDLLREYSESQI